MNDSVSINAISSSTTLGDLLLGGDFYFFTGVNYPPKRNLAIYSTYFNAVSMLANLDASVNSISNLGQNSIFVAGDFKKDFFFDDIFNHLAKFDLSLGIESWHSSSIIVFPNPFSDKITVDGVPSICSYKVIDVQGRIIQSGKLNNHEAINLENLMPGTYLLQIEHGDGIISKPIVKQ